MRLSQPLMLSMYMHIFTDILTWFHILWKVEVYLLLKIILAQNHAAE